MIRISGITKSIGKSRLLYGVSVDLRHPETLSLVGPTGCGKTLLLRILAGFDFADRGSAWHCEDQGASGTLCRVAFVAAPGLTFGSGTVHRSIAHAIPSRDRRWAARLPVLGKFLSRDRDFAALRKAHDICASLGLEPLMREPTVHLSNGQRRRLAIAIALAKDPEVLLVDDTCQNDRENQTIDAIAELAAAADVFGKSFIYASRTPVIASALNHRVAVMQAGRILQTGLPDTVYFDPDCLDVARIAGLPDTNLFPGFLAATGELHILGRIVDRLRTVRSEQVLVGVPPEAISIVVGEADSFSGTMKSIRPNGSQNRLHVDLDGCGRRIEVSLHNRCQSDLGVGRKVCLELDPAALLVFRHDGSRLRLAQLPRGEVGSEFSEYPGECRKTSSLAERFF